MSGVWKRREWRLARCLALMLAALTAIVASPARADTFDVQVDQARVMKLPDKVATIVIGNPLIADAALQAGGILVITGKGYGATNLLALDRSGRVIMDKTVQVKAPGGDDLVTVYKGVARESYSCAPECERRLTLGDSPGYFAGILSQAGSRTGGSSGGSAPAAR